MHKHFRESSGNIPARNGPGRAAKTTGRAGPVLAVARTGRAGPKNFGQFSALIPMKMHPISLELDK
jgi:hypothetical protein